MCRWTCGALKCICAYLQKKWKDLRKCARQLMLFLLRGGLLQFTVRLELLSFQLSKVKMCTSEFTKGLQHPERIQRHRRFHETELISHRSLGPAAQSIWMNVQLNKFMSPVAEHCLITAKWMNASSLVIVCVCVGSTHWLLRASLSLWECGEGLAKLLLMSAVFNSEGKASAVSLTEPDSDCCMFVLDVKSWRLTLNRSQTQANTAQWGTSGRTQQDLVSAADGRGQTATLYVREVRVQGHSVNSSTLYLISITALEWRLRETVLQFI